MVLRQYEEFLSSQELPNLDNPGRLIGGVIKRRFRWVLDKGVPYDELFHAGTWALLEVEQSESFPAPEERRPSHYWQAVVWGIQKYLRETYAGFEGEEIPLSQLLAAIERQADGDNFSADHLLKDESWGEPSSDAIGVNLLADLVTEVMRVVEASTSPLSKRSNRRKIQQTLYYFAAGYSQTVVAEIVWNVSRERLRQRVNELVELLHKDTRFGEIYGNEFVLGESRRPKLRVNLEDLPTGEELFRELFPEQEGERPQQFFVELFREVDLRLHELRAKRADIVLKEVELHEEEETTEDQSALPSKTELLALIEQTPSIQALTEEYHIPHTTAEEWLREIGAFRRCQDCGREFIGANAFRRYAGHRSYHASWEGKKEGSRQKTKYPRFNFPGDRAWGSEIWRTPSLEGGGNSKRQEKVVEPQEEIKALPYQQECLDVLQRVRHEGRASAFVVMASGLGKTVTVALDVKQWLVIHPNARVLVLCHQNDILGQTKSTFEQILGGEQSFGYYHGQEKSSQAHRVTCLFASFQTMAGHRGKFDPKEFDYVVVDESHHGFAPTYRPTIKHFRPQFLLGVTATPERTDMKDVRSIFGREVFSLTLETALARGLLTPVDYRVLTDELKDLRSFETPVGRISVTELNRRLFIPRRDEEIARLIMARTAELSDPHTIIFCASIAYCERMSRLLPSALPLHSALPYGEQIRRMGAFRRGEFSTILTVDKFNEGVDVPEVNAVVFLRSTSSKTLFYQQLGRGLRIAKGKDRVLVLDFVANCERIEMIHDLWQGVNAIRQTQTRSMKGGNVAGAIEPISVDMDTVEFVETARNILEVLKSIRAGYSQERLIGLLRRLASELERTPTAQDIDQASKSGAFPSSKTFVSYFGSVNKALQAAGLPITRYVGYTKKQLLNHLQKVAREKGRPPTRREVDRLAVPGVAPGSRPFIDTFDSFDKALRAAGLSTYHTSRTREEVLSELVVLSQKLGHTPSLRELKEASKKGKTASPNHIVKRFGSLNAALIAAELPLNKTVGYTKDQIIRALQDLARELGRTPTSQEVDEKSKVSGSNPSASTVSRLFGRSFNTALDAAGLELNRARPKEMSQT